MRYFYILTIQYYKDRTLSSITQPGEINVKPGDTRATLYNRILDEVAKAKGVDKSEAVTLHFYLEPTELNMVDLADLME